MKPKEHRLLAIEVADRAAEVLPLFEAAYPEDDRPRKAIEAARAWAEGRMKTAEARRFAMAAHAAARDAVRPEAVAAARSAGHAAATAHVPGHAKHAAAYAAKAWNFVPDNGH